MSGESCSKFLREVSASDELKQQMKAVTDVKEVIALGKSHGYTFDAQDLMAASHALSAADGAPTGSHQARPADTLRSAFYHYEYDMDQIPGFQQISSALGNLKIQPASVDLSRYAQSFCEDDLHFTSLSPTSPEFEQRYQEIMHAQQGDCSQAHAFSRRDFHLVNLDHYVEDPRYAAYFQAKTRMISLLEDFFRAEVRFSGSMWYPPNAYRLWHTNETQPGWRMYLIDFDEPAKDPAGTSFFRYMNPESKEIVTLTERPGLVRFFKIEQEKEKLFWHCIVNATTRNRWSFGFAVPENWLEMFAPRR
ncbi:MAG TPA: Nif11-like leader peptide family natural product precursor [Ktedonobacteraceae bacterium]|jgi:predicted ribosomally synthesized peptide with nif11-like leader